METVPPRFAFLVSREIRMIQGKAIILAHKNKETQAVKATGCRPVSLVAKRHIAHYRGLCM